jgi:HAMP domain-containing protein
MAATDGLQNNKQWPTTGYLSDLIGSQKTALIFDVAPYYSNQFAFVSTYSYSNAAGTTFGTLVGFAKADLATRLLTSSSAFFGGARSYFVTANGSIISTTPGVGQIVQYQASSSQIQKLNGLIGDNPVGHIESYASFDNTDMLGYLHWIPSLQSGFVVEQPQALITQQVQSLLPYNLVLVGIALLITGVVAFFGTSRIVNPLVQLSSLASGFAAGNWAERAKVNRRDEM